MKLTRISCSIIVWSVIVSQTATALEYHYKADPYPNHFYTSTSSNRALDIDSADDSGGASIIIPSDSMSIDADNTAPRDGSPVIPVGSYIDPWGDAVEQQINTDEKLNGLEGISFNRLAGTSASSGSYTAQTQLVSTNGHFGAVSIGNRKLFAYVYPDAKRRRPCRRYIHLEWQCRTLRTQSRFMAVFRHVEKRAGRRCHHLSYISRCENLSSYLGRAYSRNEHSSSESHLG